MITIIDYGIGNLGSIRNMFKRIGAPARISSDVAEIQDAEKLLLPGVGAFDIAMSQLEERGLRSVLDRKVLEDRTPTLGICLGMQLLLRGSEEGSRQGLDWIPGRAIRIPSAPGLKVPHMGWDVVRPMRSSPITADLPGDARFYFAHSYCVQVDDPADSVLRGRHGLEFDAVIQRGNIYGAQFHPEKSHRFGMHLLANFARL
jgi:glutamine amidotransferase